MNPKPCVALSMIFLLAGCAAPVPSPMPATPSQVISPPTASLTSTPNQAPTGTFTPTLIPTASLTPPPEVVRFAVFGDYGLDGPAEADVAALVHGWQPDLVLTVGDNNYPSGSAETLDLNLGKYYHDFIYPYQGTYGAGADLNRFFPVLGNHDWTTSKAKPYLDYFNLPGNERYYDFTWGPVHFFALDSDGREPDGVNAGSLQAAWLKEGLAASNAVWNIVYLHHPPYTSGEEGSIDWVQWPFAQWGADAVLSGHEHLYERLQVDGIPYFIVGTGGGGLYNFGTPLPESQFRYNANFGAMLVTASGTEMLFEFYNRTGVLIDHFSILQP